MKTVLIVGAIAGLLGLATVFASGGGGSDCAMCNFFTGTSGAAVIGSNPADGDDNAAGEAVQHGEWTEDYEKALELSAERQLPILANFTGSDWCPPCMMLEQHVFGSKTFKDWASENVVLLRLDYPRGEQLPNVKAQNAKLAQKYGIGSFPTNMILDAEGKVLGQSIGGMNDPKRFIKTMEPFMEKYEAPEKKEDQAAEVDPAQWRIRYEKRPEVNKTYDALEGKEAPALDKLTQWMNADGAQTWENYKGKIVVLDYWATWCSPCLVETVRLNKLKDQYKDKNVVFLGVHASQGVENMEKFVQDRELNYHFAADAEGELGKALGVHFLPSMFVIDGEGKIFTAHTNSKHLTQVLDHLIAERNNKDKDEEI